jgi:trehalose 6-phosphate synthase
MFDETLVNWSDDTLRNMLADDLGDAELIIVSNREPYVHERNGEAVDLQVPASGLVSALDPVARTFGGTWIAFGSGSADRETVDARDRIRVPPDDPQYTLRRVWLTQEEHHGHYSGLSNEGLWPLCHIAFTRPEFRAADWECYRAVNRKFAEVVVQEAKSDNPVILVQDYHFALLPAMVRELLPKATILTFWHIPWPNAEVFGVCPWREEILQGLLGSSIVGFHTKLHSDNFVDSVDRFVESRIDRQERSIYREGHVTEINAYPISIRWPAGAAGTSGARQRVFQRHGLADDMKLAVGVERLDYTKGLLDRFRALDAFFHDHSDWIGRLSFIQVAAPSRGDLTTYRSLQRDCAALVEDINSRYGGDGYRPVIWLEQHHGRASIDELFRAADMCVVSSLHDGMNLVAKEFVASRSDEMGVLVLSSFAGASHELADALIVNPYDAAAMAEAYYRALTMPEEEQALRMQNMREQVRVNNVYRWAGRMLLDAVRIRRRNALPTNDDEHRFPLISAGQGAPW